jgi:predicted RNase H-like HicB family nuclease
MVTKKDLNYYLSLNWSYTVEKDQEKGQDFFIVRVNELPGVCTDGRTVSEAMKNIQDAIAATIELYLEQGDQIPEPIQKEKFKGNISYRTSRERHYNLAKIAQRRHLSMNKTLDMIFDAGIRTIANS